MAGAQWPCTSATSAATPKLLKRAFVHQMSTQAAHDQYVQPRLEALSGSCEWPDEGDWPVDLFIELTNDDSVVIMERPFGTNLSDVDGDTLMQMSLSADRGMDDVVPTMAPLLLEPSRIVIVAPLEQLEHWVDVFQALASKTNVEKGSTVTSVLGIDSQLVEAAVRGLSADAPVLAFEAGNCVEVSGAEMSKALLEGHKPGYALYGLLLPGHCYPDMPFDEMPGPAPPQPGKEIVCQHISTVPICSFVPCDPVSAPATGKPAEIPPVTDTPQTQGLSFGPGAGLGYGLRP